MRISDWSSDVCSSDLEKIDWDDSRNTSRTRKRIGRSLVLWRPATHRALRGKAAPTIVADEIDAYAKKVRDAIMTLVTSRQEEFGNAAKAYLCSPRSEEHTSELQSLMRSSYAVFCMTKKNTITQRTTTMTMTHT